ncbi:hypothetical protein [Actinoplanes regularis]|uniref:hypothetical protein n=1 Tax=Actinoplanes regularis TaxID=52697 RepID=UPI00255331C0|nr:hypothetical protein [Actinoplanes regularis]
MDSMALPDFLAAPSEPALDGSGKSGYPSLRWSQFRLTAHPAGVPGHAAMASHPVTTAVYAQLAGLVIGPVGLPDVNEGRLLQVEPVVHRINEDQSVGDCVLDHLTPRTGIEPDASA